MSTLVQDAIAAELLTLTRVMSAPTGAQGYGSDLACETDLTETMLEREGSDQLVLAEALLRRIDCPRGALPDDLDYGLDVRAYLSRGTVAADLRAIRGQIAAEWTKDDRVALAVVTGDPSPSGLELALSGRITPADPTIAPFTMVLSVTSAAVLLEEISR